MKLKFRLKEQLFQIVNDTKGFTLGNLSKDNDWKHFPKPIDIIKFNNFSNEDTFRMIKLDYRKKIIESIITNLRKLDTSENPFKEIM